MNNERIKKERKLNSYIEKITLGREQFSILTAISITIGISLEQIIALVLLDKNGIVEWFLFEAGMTFIASFFITYFIWPLNYIRKTSA